MRLFSTIWTYAAVAGLFEAEEHGGSHSRAPQDQIPSLSTSPNKRKTWQRIFEKFRFQALDINHLQAPQPRSLFGSGMNKNSRTSSYEHFFDFRGRNRTETLEQDRRVHAEKNYINKRLL
jgi:hypothetical protein